MAWHCYLQKGSIIYVWFRFTLLIYTRKYFRENVPILTTSFVIQAQLVCVTVKANTY